MWWFRSYARWAACLALLTLAGQLALAFGHIHNPEATSHEVVTLAGSSIDLPPNPAAGDPPGSPDDDCRTCTIVNLINTARISDPPSVPTIFDLGSTILVNGSEHRLARSRSSLFRARAPPLP